MTTSIADDESVSTQDTAIMTHKPESRHPTKHSGTQSMDVDQEPGERSHSGTQSRSDATKRRHGQMPTQER